MPNESSLNSTPGKALNGLSLQTQMVLGFGLVFLAILAIIYLVYTFRRTCGP